MSSAAGRYALIVAVANYRDSKFRPLRAPAADADRLAAALGASEIGGFEVDVTKDEEEPQLRRRIARFFANRAPDDVLLVHFSCHGVKDDRGALYLAAPDTEMDLLDATGISSGWLNDQVERSRSKRILLLLDCCFSGAFPLGMHFRAGDSVDVQEHLGGRGRAVISASSSMEYSYEGDQLTGEAQPSIFTAALVEALETGKADRDQDRWISVDELYDFIYDRVREETPSQTPVKMGNLEGPFYIARSTYEALVEPASLDPHLTGLIESLSVGARLGAVEELTMLLRSKDRRVVLAARDALQEMLDDDSLKVRAAVSAAIEAFTEPDAKPPPEWKPEPEEGTHHVPQPDGASTSAYSEPRGLVERIRSRPRWQLVLIAIPTLFLLYLLAALIVLGLGQT